MYKQPKDAARARNARDFFRWAYANGDAQATALGYVPLPDTLVKQIEAYWASDMKF
jgi:phosphate transport system substrate-binding protein